MSIRCSNWCPRICASRTRFSVRREKPSSAIRAPSRPRISGRFGHLISIVASEVARLEIALDQLYDDHFIETCAEWVAPYIGDLVGARGAYDLGANGLSARALVANAIALRRAKGTAAAIEEVASAATLWDAVAVEFFQRVIIAQSMRLPRPARNATVGLRDLTALRRVGSAFDTIPRTIEARRIATSGGRWNLPNIGAFLRRVDARSHEWSAASPVAANLRDFFFHPLGVDTPLWAAPAVDPSINSRRTIAHVPRPIDRADMRGAIDQYWGADRALAVRVRARGAEADPARTIDPSDGPGVRSARCAGRARLPSLSESAEHPHRSRSRTPDTCRRRRRRRCRRRRSILPRRRGARFWRWHATSVTTGLSRASPAPMPWWSVRMQMWLRHWRRHSRPRLASCGSNPIRFMSCRAGPWRWWRTRGSRSARRMVLLQCCACRPTSISRVAARRAPKSCCRA